MADNNAPAATGEVLTPDQQGLALRPDVVEKYRTYLAAVPDAESDGGSGILERLAAATSLSDLNAPWESADMLAYVGVPLIIQAIRKAPSDYIGGLSFFLICDGAVRATGEKVVVVTGALDIVGQLVVAYALGKFPVTVVPEVAKNPTASGYYPQRLRFLASD